METVDVGMFREGLARAAASTAPQASLPDKDGWVNGRATFIAPLQKYRAEFNRHAH